MNLCCPNCGNDQFTATLTARIEYTYVCDSNYSTLIGRMGDIVGVDNLGDVDMFTCDDCGEDFHELSRDTLCTGDQHCNGYGSHDYCCYFPHD